MLLDPENGLKWACRHARNALRKGLILIFSETANDSRFKIQPGMAIDSLNIFTGNDVIGYFRSVANRTNMFILVSSLGRDFSIIVQPMLKKFTVLKTVIQGLHFFMRNMLDIFAP